MGVWWHALALVTHERAKMSHKQGRNVTQAGPKCHTRAKMSHGHVIMKNYCGFKTKSCCSNVCGYRRHPQTLVEICRNKGICCSFRGVATSGKKTKKHFKGLAVVTIIFLVVWTIVQLIHPELAAVLLMPWGLAAVLLMPWSLAEVLLMPWGLAAVLLMPWGLAAVLLMPWGLAAVLLMPWGLAAVLLMPWGLAIISILHHCPLGNWPETRRIGGGWVLFNPLRAKIFIVNINIYLHFVSFHHIDAMQVVEILPQIRQEPTSST